MADKPTYEELQQKIEKELRENEKKYREIIESIEDGYYEVDLSGNMTFCNSSMCRIFGYEKDELVGMNYRQYMDEVNSKSIFRTFYTVYKTGISTKALDWKLIRKDGNNCWAEASVALIKGIENQPIGFRGVVRDITDRKFSEIALRKSEEKFNLLANNVTDVIWIWDLKTTRFTYFSPSVEAGWGWTVEEALRLSLEEVVTPESLKRSTDIMTKEFHSCKPGEFRARTIELEQYRKNGEKIWIESKSSYATDIKGNITTILGISRDITKRKKAEEALKESEEKFKSIFENANDAIVYTTVEGKFIETNEKVNDILGYKKEELLGKYFSDFDILSQKDFQRTKSVFRQKNQGNDVPIMELDGFHKDGTKIHIEASSRLVIKNDEAVGILNIIRDITARKKAEYALRESERLLRQITDNMTDMVSMVDMDFKFMYVCPSIMKIMGYEPEEVIGTYIYEYLYPDDVEKVMTAVEEAIINASSGCQVFRYRHADGHYVWIEARGDIVHDENGRLIGAVFGARDINEQKRAEEELQKTNQVLEKSLKNLKKAQHYMIQSEKMAALGSLVAGVAHEINTPIGIGLTASSFLKDQTEACTEYFKTGSMEKQEMEKFISKFSDASSIIYTNLNRAASLIKSFKLVSVDQSDEVARNFNFKEYLDNTLNSLKPKYKNTEHDINMKCPNNLIIRSYPGCFSQIITNFIMNSLDHGFGNNSKGSMVIEVIQKNGNLLLNYSDNGKGMSQEIVDKIFNPFFTTNRSKGGTGLGMHIVYNIVSQKLNGHIKCASTPNLGTTFSISIPLNS